jgi:hypothetical protein
MTDAAGHPAGVRTVKVMLPTGDRIPFAVTPSMTVSDLAGAIAQDSRGLVPPNRLVLLVYHGRVLQGTETVSHLDTMPEFTVHALFRTIAAPAPAVVAASELRGFDRLSRMNYAPADITQLRDNFHIMHGTVNANREAQIEAEEEWFPVIFNNENPVQNLQLPPAIPRQLPDAQNEIEEDIPYTFDRYPWVKIVLGIFLGTLFGVSSVIFMLMPRSDGTFFTGLFVGVVLHLLIKWYLDVDIL